ncbi:MAG TPA: CehA/McbA family metallohydrolase [Pirellulales bacterium]|nr:CehA/McbA family metallohydrolase [Pirellulales bacterium]
MYLPRKPASVVVCAAILFGTVSPALAVGELTLTIVDTATGKPVPCRMHLRNGKGKPQRATRMLFWHDHFTLPGTVKLKLPPGTYQFEIERGLEYARRGGHFVMEKTSQDQQVLDLPRVCNMADEGWWSGDLHLHRPIKDIEQLMLSDDLHVAAPITWSEKKNEWAGRPVPTSTLKEFDGNRYYYLLAGESAAAGGSLLILNAGKPLSGEGKTADDQLKLLAAAREEPAAWIDVSRPAAWDLPLWLATGRVDSIELCHDQFCRSETIDDANGRPRDKKIMPGASGIGRWTHEIYYHVLNCGLRIPPSAGSGSGESSNPVGYDRVYAWVDKDQFSYEAWWKAVRMGRTVVTNGPLIRPFANGHVPGHVFALSEGPLSVEVVMSFAGADPISYFELVKNGRVAQSIRFEELAKDGRFRPLEFEESGWFLVRAVTDVAETYRFASSAPWFVEIGSQPKRISKASANFFLDWLDERREAMEDGGPLSDLSAKVWDEAKGYWDRLVAEANAD